MTCQLGANNCPGATSCPAGSIFKPNSPVGTCTECRPVPGIPAGLYCINGTVELCPNGFYCPYSVGAGPVLCPEGFICRESYTFPVACSVLSYCPAGATEKDPAPAFIGILIMMIVLTLSSLWLIGFVRKRRSQKAVTDSEFRKQVSLAYGEVVQAITGSPLVGGPLLGFNEKIKYAYPVSIEFENLGMTLKSTAQVVLEGVSGQFPPGSLVAVMGGSGAGKSTFLNALANRAPYGKISGNVTMNKLAGQTIGEHPRLVGFVPQDDIMHDDLTVYENLLYSARLRLPPSFSLAQKKAIVEDVLEILDLVRIRNSVVGSAEKRGISGGQKKRVSIGIELVAYPRVLFLDEPTSGLDSASAMKVARCLQKMRSLGITVVSVIHQPRWSVFRSFSHCLLLAKGGKTAYLGPTNAVQEYFEKLGFHLPQGENVADWFIDILGGQTLRTDEKGEIDRSFVPEKDLPRIWVEKAMAALLDKTAKENKKQRLTKVGTKAFDTHKDELHFELQSGLSMKIDDELTFNDFERLCGINGIEPESPEITKSLYAQFKNSVPIGATLTIESLSQILSVSVEDDLAKQNLLKTPPELEQTIAFRPGPSFTSQVRSFFSRNCAKLNALDITIKCLICGFGGAIVALTSRGVLSYSLIPLNSQNGLLLFTILTAASFMYVFGDEKLVFTRESETGLSVTAYWLAKNLVNLFDLALITFYYYTFYFAIYQLDYSYGDGLLTFLLVAFYTSAISHFFSITMGPSTGLLLAVMVPAIEICVLGGVKPTMAEATTFQSVLFYASIGFYSIEDLSLYEVKALPSNVQQLPAVKDMLSTYSYSLDHLTRNLIISAALGLIVRLLALIAIQIKVRGCPGSLTWDRIKTRVIRTLHL